jgi:hypothetical protein
MLVLHSLVLVHALLSSLLCAECCLLGSLSALALSRLQTAIAVVIDTMIQWCGSISVTAQDEDITVFEGQQYANPHIAEQLYSACKHCCCAEITCTSQHVAIVKLKSRTLQDTDADC